MKGDRYLDAEELKAGDTLTATVHRTGKSVSWTIAQVGEWSVSDSRNWLTVTDTDGATHRLSPGSYRTTARSVKS